MIMTTTAPPSAKHPAPPSLSGETVRRAPASPAPPALPAPPARPTVRQRPGRAARRRMETDYGRDLVAENCQKCKQVERIGFFGARARRRRDLDTGNAQTLPKPSNCME